MLTDGVIMMMIAPEGDESVKLAEDVRAAGVEAPGTFLVDSIPFREF